MSQEKGQPGETGTDLTEDTKFDEALLARASRISRLAAVFSAAVGFFVLVGWAFGIESLKRVIPGLVAMNPATALSLIFAGFSLWLLRSETVQRPVARQSLARVAAFLMFAIGFLKLVEILTGYPIGIDRILFANRLEAEGAGLPNRMAPNTALNLCLIGGTLLLLDKRVRRGPQPAQVLALAASLPVLMAILGYSYGTSSFYVVGSYIPMALHTAVTMGVLLVGIMFARPKRGVMTITMSPNVGGITARTLLPAAVCIPAFLGWLRLAGQRVDWYDSSTGASLFAVSTIVFLTAAIWWTSHSLGQLDSKRQRTEKERYSLARRLNVLSLLNQRVMKYSLDVICTLNEEGRFTQASPACEKIWGYTPEEMVCRKYADMVVPEDLQSSIDAAAQVMAGHPLSNFENRYVRKDGQIVFMAWSAVWSVEDKTMFCVARDITERRQARAKLEQSQRQLEAAQHVARLGSWEWDVRTGEIVWSDELYRLLGFEPGEVEPGYESYLDRVHPDDRETVRTMGQTVIKEKGSMNYDYRIILPDGATRVLYARGELLLDDVGEPLKLVGSTQDITERKTNEEELQRAKEEAERANKARSEFLSRMSHELRTPLNAILGFAQLLEMEDLEGLQKDSVDQILRGGRHLLQLVNEVLDIASIDAGRLALSPEPVQLSDVAGEVTTLLQPLAAERRVSLINDIAEDDHVVGDRHRLKQVLLNLVSNAVKYNREGGSVRVSLGQATAPGKTRFEVTDTGPGISAAGLEKLFSPFERLDAVQRGVIEGTGIGLTITERLVKLMDGEIGVRSVQGEGSTFWAELPTAEDPVKSLLEKNKEAAAAEPVARIQGKTKCVVLSIEDNLSNLRLVEHILERRPEVELVAAMQGSIGLELAREHRPHLILLDLHLPDINGDEVLRRLQSESLTRDIPVVMVSADATPRQIQRLLEEGARAYLTKPLDVAQFLQVLDENLHSAD